MHAHASQPLGMYGDTAGNGGCFPDRNAARTDQSCSRDPMPLLERVARRAGRLMCVRIAMFSLSPCGRGWRAAPGN